MSITLGCQRLLIWLVVEIAIVGWFVPEVESGLAQIERGQTLSHDEVGARVLSRRALPKGTS